MTDPTYDDGALRRMADGSGPRSEQAAAIRRLASEVLRLRALPVLRTCGACASYGQAEADDGCGPCHHAASLIATPHGLVPAATMGDAPPPSWCPLRGAR